MRDEMIELTKQLVAVASVNSTPGEKKIADYIESYFRQMPYFQKHPEYVIVQPLKNDSLNRRNVIVLIRGEKEATEETVILHGHTDTVGVDDFGKWKEYAFDCDKLAEVLKDAELAENVKKDYESGEYMFGRGTCDMKGGDAVFMVMAKHICEDIEHFKGNLLLSFNPVEENQHTGIIEAREIFEQLSEQYHLQYKLAINNDYICPMYEGDMTRYIYTGAVGKLLPCFYVKGLETHVGQCYEGFDASLAAAEIVNQIHLNPELCDVYQNEYTLPPAVLKMKDLKEQYNVQTAHASFVYFNYFLHYRSTEEVIKQLASCAKKAFDIVEEKINDRYAVYCEKTKKKFVKRQFEKEVITYAELFEKASKIYQGDLKAYLDRKTVQMKEEKLDSREISMEITKMLVEMIGVRHPLAVLFFAAPYCPHNTLKHEVPEEEIWYQRLSKIAEEFSKTSGENYELNQFFPSLTDSSYLKIDDSDESIDALISNFTQYDQLYAVPLDKIKKLNIPAVNYGVWGKDAHKWTERIHLRYSFEVLPAFLSYTLNQIFM